MKNLILILSLIFCGSIGIDAQTPLPSSQEVYRQLKTRVLNTQVSQKRLERITERYVRTGLYDVAGRYSIPEYGQTLDLITWDIDSLQSHWGLVNANQQTIIWDSVQIYDDGYLYGLHYYPDTIHNGVLYQEWEAIETSETVDSAEILGIFTDWGGLYNVQRIYPVDGSNQKWYIEIKGQRGSYYIASDDGSVAGGTPRIPTYYNSSYMSPHRMDRMMPVWFGNVTLHNAETTQQRVWFFDALHAWKNPKVITSDDSKYMPMCTKTVTLAPGETKTVSSVWFTNVKFVDSFGGAGIEINFDGYIHNNVPAP